MTTPRNIRKFGLGKKLKDIIPPLSKPPISPEELKRLQAQALSESLPSGQEIATTAIEKGIPAALNAYDAFLTARDTIQKPGKMLQEKHPALAKVQKGLHGAINPLVPLMDAVGAIEQATLAPLADPVTDRLASVAPESWGGLIRGEGVKTGSGKDRHLDYWTPVEDASPIQKAMLKAKNTLIRSMPGHVQAGIMYGEGVKGLVKENLEQAIGKFGTELRTKNLISEQATANLQAKIAGLGRPKTPSGEENTEEKNWLQNAYERFSPAQTKFERARDNELFAQRKEIESKHGKFLPTSDPDYLKAKYGISEPGTRQFRHRKEEDLTKLAPGIRFAAQELPLGAVGGSAIAMGRSAQVARLTPGASLATKSVATAIEKAAIPLAIVEEGAGTGIKAVLKPISNLPDTIYSRRLRGQSEKTIDTLGDDLNKILKEHPNDITLEELVKEGNQHIEEAWNLTDEVVDDLKLSKRKDNYKKYLRISDEGYGPKISRTPDLKVPTPDEMAKHEALKSGIDITDPKTVQQAMVPRDLTETATPKEEMFSSKNPRVVDQGRRSVRVVEGIKRADGTTYVEYPDREITLSEANRLYKDKRLTQGNRGFKVTLNEMKAKPKIGHTVDVEPSYTRRPEILVRQDAMTLSREQIIDTVLEAHTRAPERLPGIRRFLKNDYTISVATDKPGVKVKQNKPLEIFDKELDNLGYVVDKGRLLKKEAPSPIAQDLPQKTSSFEARVDELILGEDNLPISPDIPPTDHPNVKAWENAQKNDSFRKQLAESNKIQDPLNPEVIVPERTVKDPNASPKRVDIDPLDPTPVQAQQEATKLRRNTTVAGRINQAFEEQVIPNKFTELVQNDIQRAAVKLLGADGEGLSSLMIRGLTKVHDSHKVARELVDNGFRVASTKKSLQLGFAEDDLVSNLILGPNAHLTGYKRSRNFTLKIEPLLGDGVEFGHINLLQQFKHYEDMIRAGRAGNIPTEIFDPMRYKVIDPSTGKAFRMKVDKKLDNLRNEVNKYKEELQKIEISPVDPSTGKPYLFPEKAKDWIKTGEYTYSKREVKTAWDRVEYAQASYNKLMSQVLNELTRSGKISSELAQELRIKYPNFNPTQYLFAKDQLGDLTDIKVDDIVDWQASLGKFRDLGPEQLDEKVWAELQDDLGGAVSPLEALDKYMANHQRMIVDQDTTTSFIKMLKIFKQTEDVTADIVKLHKHHKQPLQDFLYDEKVKSGYIRHTENGKMKIYGTRTADGKPAPIHKLYWDLLEGVGGIRHRGGYGIEEKAKWAFTGLAQSNNLIKSLYTTYDPVFMMGNSVIDGMVVALKARIMPWTVVARMMKSAVKAINESKHINYMPDIVSKQAKFDDLQELAGARKGKFGQKSRLLLDFEKSVKDSGHDVEILNSDYMNRSNFRRRLDLLGAELMNYPQMSYTKEAAKKIAATNIPIWGKPIVTPFALTAKGTVNVGRVTKHLLERASDAAEQAPRMTVAEKLAKLEIGRPEFNRLFGRGLSTEEYEDQLFKEWTPHFDKYGKPIRPKIGPNGEKIYPGKGYGFLESPELRKTSISALESTVNFYRGGTTIKFFNNYLMFLNAGMEGLKLPFRALGVDLQPKMRPKIGAKFGESPMEFGTYDRVANSTYTDADILSGGIEEAIMGGGVRKNNSPFTAVPFKKGRAGVTSKYDELLGQYNISPILKKLPGIGKHMPEEIQTDAKVMNALTLSMMTTAYGGIMAYNLSHPEYFDIPAYIRYNAIVIMRPALLDENGNKITDENGNVIPRYFTIPHKTRELALAFGTMAYVMEQMFTDHPTHSKLYWQNMYFATSPVVDRPSGGFMDGVLGTITPEILAIAKNNTTGWDDWRNAPIVNEELAHLPIENQHTEYTSTTWRMVAKRVGDFEKWAKIHMPEILKSPARLDHLAGDLTGGLGENIISMSDFAIQSEIPERAERALRNYIFKNTQEFKREGNLPIEILADLYRNGSYADKNEIKATLAPDEVKAMMIEVRKKRNPEKLADQIVAFFNLDRFVKERGGGEKELAYAKNIELVEKETGVKISREEGQKAAKAMAIWADDKLNEQKFLDDRLKDNTISGKTWVDLSRGLFHDSYKRSNVLVADYGEYILKKPDLLSQYPNSIQAQLKPGEFNPITKEIYEGPDVKKLWYDNIYTAAGTLKDSRSKAQILLSGYYSIKNPYDDPNKTWPQTEKEKQTYINWVKKQGLHKEFESLRLQKLTPTQKSYDLAEQVMAQYLDFGRNLDQVWNNWKASHPEGQDWWTEYLTGDDRVRSNMIEIKAITGNKSDDEANKKHNIKANFLKKTISQRKKLREVLVIKTDDQNMKRYGERVLEGSLVYWKGYSGFTDYGKQLKSEIDAKQIKYTDIPFYGKQRLD